MFEIEKLAHGGMGIVRDGRRAIFVPYVVPGEVVMIRLTQGTRKVEGVVTNIVTGSPDRVAPPCPLFGRCGGCQLQHISYPAQLRYKKDILAESLFWIGRIEVPIEEFVPSPMTFNYRSRVRFHARRNRAGFFAREKKQFLPVTNCYITYDIINRAIPTLDDIIKGEDPDTIELIDIRREGILQAVVEGGRRRKIYETHLGEAADEAKWSVASGAKVVFQQVNIEQNEALRELVEKALAKMRPQNAIELYAGSGNLTEIILRHCSSVVAIEAEREAVELAGERFASVSESRLKFERDSAENYLESAASKTLKPDVIVLDPPRTGAKNALAGIVRLNPEHIIYVSCEPATLARDLKELCAKGYQIKSVTPIDMFPQTSHIEAVAILSK